MTDLESQKADASWRILRFSTFGLLLLITVASLVLAAVFSVGRALGMETSAIISNGLQPLLQYTPLVIVLVLAIAAAWNSPRLPQSTARLTIIACCGLLLTVLATVLMQLIVIRLMENSSIGFDQVGWWFLVLGIVFSLLHAACWMLLLIAVFSGRTSAPMTPTTNSTP
jgi:hypothetical protein